MQIYKAMLECNLDLKQRAVEEEEDEGSVDRLVVKTFSLLFYCTLITLISSRISSHSK